jgi:hypothetical protein
MTDLTNPFEEMEILNLLMTEASERGFITYDKILEVMPEIESNVPFLETIMEEMQSMGIPIYESEDDLVTEINSVTKI